MGDQSYLELQGLPVSVSLPAELTTAEALSAVFQNWPYRITPQSALPNTFAIAKATKSYILTTPYLKQDKRVAEPADALCALVAELAWALLEANPGMLCLHGAAIEIDGRLIVIPNTARAGKSTLTTVLAARGHRVFTDDFLPVRLSDDQQVLGISCGVAPRLRRPPPQDLAAATHDFITARTGFQSKRYAYVNPHNGDLADHGASAPIGAIVLLERDADRLPDLSPVPRGITLKSLILQNFSRSMNAAGIVAMLEFLARNLPGYHLQAQNAEQAANLIETRLDNWSAPVPHFPHPADSPIFNQRDTSEPDDTPRPDIDNGPLMRVDDTALTELDGMMFVTSSQGRKIHHLNDGAMRVWHLLAEPTSLPEATQLLCAAFPDASADQIAADTRQIFEKLGRNGLIRPAQGRGKTATA